jgi:hypothetical protein
MKVKKWIKAFMGENDRTLLTGLAVGGVLLTVGLAVRATKRLIEKKPEIDAAETTKEKVIIVAKEVAPAVVAGVATEAVILKGHKVASDKIAALSQAVTITTGSYNAYKQIVEENVDEDKLKQIKELFSKKEVDDTVEQIQKENPGVKVKTRVIDTGTGDALFQLDGILFRSNKSYIDGVFCDADYQLREDYYISREELHQMLGIYRLDNAKKTDDQFQWDFPNRGDRIKPVYSEGYIHAALNEPVITISYEKPPRFKYKL